MTIDELITIFEKVKFEWGNDSKVYFQHIDENGKPTFGDRCYFVYIGKDGTIVLTNNEYVSDKEK